MVFHFTVSPALALFLFFLLPVAHRSPIKQQKNQKFCQGNVMACISIESSVSASNFKLDPFIDVMK